MYLDETRAQERLTSERNLANRFGRSDNFGSYNSNGNSNGSHTREVPAKTPEVVETTIKKAGNRQGNQYPQFIRNTVAILTRSGESGQSVAREFGMTKQNANHITKFATTLDEKAIDEKLGQAKDIALDRLTAALLGISDDKLSTLGPEKLSNVAANMSRVVEKMTPRQAGNEGNQVQIHIYSPETRREELYASVTV